MKKFILLLSIATTATSCQNSPSQSEQNRSASSQLYRAQIKSEKQKQAELDLPFRGFDDEKSLETIAFGSCADQDQPQPIWTSIEKNHPEIMIMLGDNVYASKPEQKPVSSDASMPRSTASLAC